MKLTAKQISSFFETKDGVIFFCPVGVLFTANYFYFSVFHLGGTGFDLIWQVPLFSVVSIILSALSALCAAIICITALVAWQATEGLAWYIRIPGAIFIFLMINIMLGAANGD